MQENLSVAEPVIAERTAAPASVAPHQAPKPDRFIREAECFSLSGLSRTTRWRLERKGLFPKRRQLSENAIGWDLAEVLAWRASRPLVAAAA